MPVHLRQRYAARTYLGIGKRIRIRHLHFKASKQRKNLPYGRKIFAFRPVSHRKPAKLYRRLDNLLIHQAAKQHLHTPLTAGRAFFFHQLLPQGLIIPEPRQEIDGRLHLPSGIQRGSGKTAELKNRNPRNPIVRQLQLSLLLIAFICSPPADQELYPCITPYPCQSLPEASRTTKLHKRRQRLKDRMS